MEIGIRGQRPGDAPGVRDVLERSFATEPVVADLAEALRQGPAGAAGLSFVAENAGEIVGHVQLTRSWVDAPRRLVEVLVLSPLGVVPALQGRGIGARLVTRALDEAARAGAPLVFLEGSPDYYPRFGFERASARGFTAPSTRIPDAAFQVDTLPAHEEWMTGAVVYAERFWSFDCVGLRD
ncbi:GNAT family N-acetyltransferase [Prauserella cavernicola]|uniref:N-acetyltransferase n=1 Tax=Prauserella cavernicola TaxID=2800127 RepID=A0A934V3H6_9PSEU|nr:N-acetyltransferase [Prauserella cavernicola]MBK1783025.1 N-acetyltransferase [Prauserella cavernicola]